MVVPERGCFVVSCSLVSAPLLERCRLRCRSISAKLGTAPSRSTALRLSIQQAHPPSTRTRDSGQGRRYIDRLGTFVRLTRPSLPVAERLLVRDTEDYGDIVCAVSVEHVRRDLELITVVQHCLNLVDFVGGEFASTLADVDVADCHRIHDARAELCAASAETC